MEREKKKGFHFGKGKILVLAALLAVAAAVLFFTGNIDKSAEKVDFQIVKEERIPKDITSDVIPEYKTLERALACVVDDDVYVIVTRGEKPTSGFGVSIDKMTVEEKEDKTNLIVYAEFDDPQKETAISQIITYPICVAKTDLQYLPDSIELRIQY